MILFDGTVYETAEQNRLLDLLEMQINQTRATLSIDAETVIRAVEKLRERVLAGEFNKDNDKQKHEEAFLTTAIDVCNIINQNKPDDAEDTFSFGNAQKFFVNL